jgi:hypothetical protein
VSDRYYSEFFVDALVNDAVWKSLQSTRSDIAPRSGRRDSGKSQGIALDLFDRGSKFLQKLTA